MSKIFERKYFVDYLLSGGGLFLLVLFIGKFYFLKELPLELSYDESYYWDWSRHLDWGYYSKPPMVAWVIYVSSNLLGSTEWAVRLPALLFNTFTLALGYVMTSRFLGFSTGRIFLFTLAFTPIFWIYSFVMTIDPPLLFFWTLSFYWFVRYIQKPNSLWALLTGLAIGLGLLTKQTMFLFLPLGFLYCWLFERELLKKRETLLIPTLSLLVYLPNFLWNVKRDFLLWEHTKAHFSRSAFSMDYYLLYFGGLLILFGVFFVPLFFELGFRFFKLIRLYLKGALRELKEREEGTILKVLFCSYIFSFPPLFFILVLSLFKKFNHNWIMPFFITAYIWVSYLAMGHKFRKLLLYLNLLIGIFLSLLVIAVAKKPYIFPGEGGKILAQTFYKFVGWKELAKEVSKVYDSSLPLLVSHREIASSLAFYLSEHPHPYVLNLENQINNQYHLWRRDEELIGREVLLVKKGSDIPSYIVKPQKLGEVVIEVGNKKKIYSIWRGIFFKGNIHLEDKKL
ncbi:MAG: glycosyltransferase family 39 protein [Caldimicrobium sp.]|nr:glycosyltransferase family 39 protein [Caldimicrobium sp.]MCX7874510.1 glycosyltransferase family 39 protein [Caldimicrobium sp.]MDW8094533.1 glycosyltransferase family 39 protein [Caldimicrobium sp.]